MSVQKMDDGNDQRNRDRSRRGERQSRFSDAKKERSRDRTKENRIFVSNIPYGYKWGEVKDLFREQVGDVAYVELFNDENKQSRGCGIVEFNNPESVKRAMEVMHRFSINGRKLVIKEDLGEERDKFGRVTNKPERNMDHDRKRMERNRDNSGMFDSGEPVNTYGLSYQFLEQIGVNGPLINKVFVANLDYKVDAKKLKEVFKMAGKVRNIDLCLDKDGNSRGFAVIEYDHPVEAVQAISLFDKQYLFERKLNVRMDRAVSDKTEIRLPEGLKSIGVGLGPNGEPLRDVVRTLSQTNMSNNNINNLGTGIFQNSLSLSNLNAATLGNAVLGAAGPLAGNLGLQALGLNMGNIQNQLLQQASSELNLNAGNALSNQNLNLQGGIVGNGNMGGFGRPTALTTTNFVPPNMGSNNRAQMSNTFNNQPLDLNNASPRTMEFRHLGREGDGMQNNQQKKPNDTIHISNLPSSITWQLLREKFGDAGDIKYAEKSGKETAIITFQSEWAASRAIKLFDGTRIDGRTINVTYY